MNDRKGFGSNFGFLMAAVGSAVGLGNIWGFPNKMGANGGFPFLILYLALALCCGVIIMLGELALGRKTGHGAVGAYQSISKRFKWLGWLGIAAAALIFSFYSALGGYCLRYVVVNFGNLIGAEFGTNGVGGADVFQGLLSQPERVHRLCTGLHAHHHAGGHERRRRRHRAGLLRRDAGPVLHPHHLHHPLLHPAGCGGRPEVYVRPRLGRGQRHHRRGPGFWKVLTAAGGQMFFSLSLGAGVMITYGSYLDKKQDLGKSAMIIVGMDTVVALMAGLCVIPGRFALDPNGALGGPELLFITMQNVFDKMGPAGPVFGILFYLLVFFAAISSSISMLEVIVAHFCDKAREKGKGDRRKLYSAIAVVICAALCALVCADGMGSNHISPAELLGLAGAKLPGWSTSWLGLFDSVAEGLLMPLGALLMCLMISWELKPDTLRQEILLNGENRPWVYDFFRLCVKYITPLCMLMILYGQISDFFIV
ncbi:MAG: sodium-dependent transporter [Vescimonas sp.]